MTGVPSTHIHAHVTGNKFLPIPFRRSKNIKFGIFSAIITLTGGRIDFKVVFASSDLIANFFATCVEGSYQRKKMFFFLPIAGSGTRSNQPPRGVAIAVKNKRCVILMIDDKAATPIKKENECLVQWQVL